MYVSSAKCSPRPVTTRCPVVPIFNNPPRKRPSPNPHPIYFWFVAANWIKPYGRHQNTHANLHSTQSMLGYMILPSAMNKQVFAIKWKLNGRIIGWLLPAHIEDFMLKCTRREDWSVRICQPQQLNEGKRWQSKRKSLSACKWIVSWFNLIWCVLSAFKYGYNWIWSATLILFWA